jgi:hypothetical protein
MCRQILVGIQNVKIHRTPSNRVLCSMRTRRQTDMTKLIVAFLSSVNTPEHTKTIWQICEVISELIRELRES